MALHLCQLAFSQSTNNSNHNSRLPIYQPTIWSHDFIQGLDAKFPINSEKKVKELEKKVNMAFNIDNENGNFSVLKLLEHVDDIERLGLGYRFQREIQKALDMIILVNESHVVGLEEKKDNLHAASLRFRLLRQHGYYVSQGNQSFSFRTDQSLMCKPDDAIFILYNQEPRNENKNLLKKKS